MAEAPGSRAIRIPLQSSSSDAYTASNRRRRGAKAGKERTPAGSLEAGPSSSVSSEPESSWSSTPRTFTVYQAQKSIASPSVKDPCLREYEEERHTKKKDKQKAVATTPPSTPPPRTMFQPSSPLGPSMLASSSYKSVNLNAHNDDPDEPPRLICYTKQSQGFIWNDELFLPSYMIGRRGGRKKQYDADFGGDDDGCQVAEIFLTDEEVAAFGISG